VSGHAERPELHRSLRTGIRETLGRNKKHFPMSKGLIWLMFHPLQVRQGPMEN
jgi:hypothetical protein